MALNFQLPIGNRQLKILGDRSMSDVIRKGVRVKHINKVAILGAGTMGARIAAHFANAGVPSYLLDIVPPDADAPARSKVAAAGLEAAKKSKPAAFFEPSLARLVTVGNFEDDLGKLSEVNWIIEAVVENLDIKRALLKRVDAIRKPGTIITTNTSGLPVAKIAEGFSDDFRRCWFGTHFFNPPRYMRLLESIPTPETDRALMDAVAHFADVRLGKGVVFAQDTPNFIANRIGTFSVLNVMRLMQEMDFTIEEVDALTGQAVGWPKSATFRTIDLVGLDILGHVVGNMTANVHDERSELRFPDFFGKMLGLDGGAQKTDKAGAFLWAALSDLWTYSANRVPEISNSIVEIDRAMRLGFNWELGPFELWDAAGVEATVARMKKEGKPVAANVERLLASGQKSWYIDDPKSPAGRKYWESGAESWEPIQVPPGVSSVTVAKKSNGVVKKNSGASLVDLGDGVACIEFHSKMNSLGADIITLITQSLKPGGPGDGFDAFVITNDATNFSVGANLMLLLMSVQEEEWDEVDLAIRQFQGMTQAIKFSPKPVVSAPFGLCLGGGTEISLHAAARQPHAELYTGLVEVGVGLLPGGGGCKEMLLRAVDSAAHLKQGTRTSPAGLAESVELLEAMKKAFETIATAKVATSAHEARNLGFLYDSDRI